MHQYLGVLGQILLFFFRQIHFKFDQIKSYLEKNLSGYKQIPAYFEQIQYNLVETKIPLGIIALL